MSRKHQLIEDLSHHFIASLEAWDRDFRLGAIGQALHSFDKERTSILQLIDSIHQAEEPTLNQCSAELMRAGGELLAFRLTAEERIHWARLALPAANRLGARIAASVLGQALQQRGEFNEAERVYRDALRLAEEDNDRWNQGRLSTALSSIILTRKSPHEAQELLVRALQCAEDVRDHRGGLHALTEMAMLLDEQHRPEALPMLHRALHSAEQLHDQRSKARILGALGVYHRTRGALDASSKATESQLELARLLGDRRQEGIALSNQGAIHHSRGDTDSALRAFQESLAIRKELSDPSGQGQVHGNIGLLFKNQGRLDEAAKHFQTWLALARESEDLWGVSRALSNLSSTLRVLGHTEASRKMLADSETLDRHLGNRRGEVINLQERAHHAWATDDVRTAAKLWLDAVEKARDYDFPEAELVALTNLAMANRQCGYADAALTYSRAALARCEETGLSHREGVIRRELGIALAMEGDEEEAVAELQRAIAAHERHQQPGAVRIRAMLAEAQGMVDAEEQRASPNKAPDNQGKPYPTSEPPKQ